MRFPRGQRGEQRLLGGEFASSAFTLRMWSGRSRSRPNQFAKTTGRLILCWRMKQFITDTLIEFQRGRLTLEEAANRLLRERTESKDRKARSNRRLKAICGALQRERDPTKVRELKSKLSREFYHGDEA